MPDTEIRANRHDTVAALIKNGVYTCNITVSIGSNELSLSADVLNLSTEVHRALQKAKVTPQKTPIMMGLKSLRSRLETKRRRLQDVYMINLGGSGSNSLRVISANNMEHLDTTLKEMESMVEEYIQALRDGEWEQERQDYLQRVQQILVSAYTSDPSLDPTTVGEKVGAVSSSIAGIFPSIEQVEAKIKVELSHCLRIPSLVESIGHEKKRLDAFNEHLEANKTRIANQLIIKSSQGLINTIESAFSDARREILSTITETVKNLEGLEPDQINKNHQKQVNSLLERFSALQNMDASLDKVAGQLQSIRFKISNGANMAEELEALKNEISGMNTLPREEKSSKHALTI